jgi:hypothetical protein
MGHVARTPGCFSAPEAALSEVEQTTLPPYINMMNNFRGSYFLCTFEVVYLMAIAGTISEVKHQN